MLKGQQMLREKMNRLIRAAWEEGQSIDLQGVGYGRIHWRNQRDISTEPLGYYHTLAGFASVIKAQTVLEIGTHWGGSSAALVRGMSRHSSDPLVVTVDITTESDQFLPHSPERTIIKLVGNAHSIEVVRAAQQHLFRADMMFVDADHVALSTLENFCVYETLFQPKLVLFDDILLNEEMRTFWSILTSAFPDHTANCAEIEPRTRHPVECGFGMWVSPSWDFDG